MDINDLTEKVIGAAIRIHQELGPGLFESVYETILARDLADMGLEVERQKAVPLTVRGITFRQSFRADLIVEGVLLIEIKCAGGLASVHEKQVLTYLRLLDLRVGLLFDFAYARMKDGIKRIVNGYLPADYPLAPPRRYTER